MPRGGRRPGSGPKPRTRPTRTKYSAAIVKKAIAEGKALPLDVMLFAMDHYFQKATEVEGVVDETAMREASLIAQAAAPYCHPRLNAIAAQTEVTTTYIARLPSPITSIEEWQTTMQTLLPSLQ
jgi:hypothetical protein